MHPNELLSTKLDRIIELLEKLSEPEPFSNASEEAAMARGITNQQWIDEETDKTCKRHSKINEWRHRMSTLGALVDEVDERDYKIATFMAPTPIPVKYDLSHLMLPVRNQGQEGTCVSFAATAVKESEELHATYLSPRFMNDRIGLPAGGAYPRDAMKLLNEVGVCPESCQPYIAGTRSLPCIDAIEMAKENKIKAYARLTTLDEMKQCLFINGPFLITVGVTNEWYKTGSDGRVFHSGKDFVGYHGIVFVAYNDETRLVKIRNSWGSGWGENGYGYLSYPMVEDILIDAWSSIDVPEQEEEKYVKPIPIPTPIPEKNFLEKIGIWIHLFMSKIGL